MPAFFLELFSEEIPARMQARAAEDLSRLFCEAAAALSPRSLRAFAGPRRIALAAEIDVGVAARRSTERGPRVGAPEQAIAGFLRKHGAARDDLQREGDFWVLEKSAPAIPAAHLIAQAMPTLLRRFPWPKSMRWGGTSQFAWVRPLRRIVCLLDHAVVAFDLREGEDDGHGLASSNVTEGHRFLAPGAVAVASVEDWQETLRTRRVIADAAERRAVIAEGIARLAAEQGFSVVPDDALLDEVAGLVEWPVPMLGRIDAGFRDLPPEVMQVSMRVNQRVFALSDAAGAMAPAFAFVANIEPDDGGAAIVAGNERVLRARFADARHFWDLDRRIRLFDRVPPLDGITFHAKLGSQGDRVRRLVRLSRLTAPEVGADPELAARAALLAKADLTSGMVGEFPELQGVIGRYYALHDGEDPRAADAVRDHYAPRGPTDTVPSEPVGIAVALADKLDQLATFFSIGEKPTGSGDPYALRRAALGVIRLLRENGLRVRLVSLLEAAGAANGDEVLGFIVDRLRVQLRAEGARHDVLAAVFAASDDDDIVRLLALADALASLLGSEDGTNLLTANRRAVNILRIEEKKDGPHDGTPDRDRFREREEHALADALDAVEPAIYARLGAEDFAGAMRDLAHLRAPLDGFFDRVTVNADDPDLRRNRLRLLARVRTVMNRVADFSKIEG